MGLSECAAGRSGGGRCAKMPLEQLYCACVQVWVGGGLGQWSGVEVVEAVVEVRVGRDQGMVGGLMNVATRVHVTPGCAEWVVQGAGAVC
jgi:hypothetical protein